MDDHVFARRLLAVCLAASLCLNPVLGQAGPVLVPQAKAPVGAVSAAAGAGAALSRVSDFAGRREAGPRLESGLALPSALPAVRPTADALTDQAAPIPAGAAPAAEPASKSLPAGSIGASQPESGLSVEGGRSRSVKSADRPRAAAASTPAGAPYRTPSRAALAAGTAPRTLNRTSAGKDLSGIARALQDDRTGAARETLASGYDGLALRPAGRFFKGSAAQHAVSGSAHSGPGPAASKRPAPRSSAKASARLKAKPQARGPPAAAPSVRELRSVPAGRRAAAVALVARRLADGPINSWAYASEMPFLRSFSRLAHSLFGSGGAPFLSSERKLAEAVAEWFEHEGAGLPERRFRKNMAILTDDLYLLSVLSDEGAGERLPLAGLRARYGDLSASRRTSAPGDDPRAGKTRKAGWARKARGSTVSRLFFGKLGRALREALSFIEAKDPSILGFPEVTRRWALSARRRAMLSEFYDRLAVLIRDFDSLEKPSVWETAIDVTGGDRALAAEMLGGIVGQTKRPLRFVERELLGSVPAEETLSAFEKAAKAYYLLGLAHEKSLRRFGRSTLYPAGTDIRSPKFWHFYAAAMLGRRLRAYPRETARTAARLIAMGYEAVTFPIALRMLPFGWRGFTFRLLIGSYGEDVRTQMRGHAFGRRWAEPGRTAKAETDVPGSGRTRTAVRPWLAYVRYSARLFTWNFASPALREWPRLRDRARRAEASGRRPSAKRLRRLFVALRLLAWTGRLSPAGAALAASDDRVAGRARRIFARHFDAGQASRAAFEAFLSRAREDRKRRRTKLGKTLRYALKEAAVLESSALAAHFDGLLQDRERTDRFRSRGQGQILSAFEAAVREAVRRANETAVLGGRVLGVRLTGSYASGAARPGSDLDFQVITEDGRASPAGRLFVEVLRGLWSGRQASAPLDADALYLPPSRELFARLDPEGYAILSPYPKVVEDLRAAGPEEAAPGMRADVPWYGGPLRAAAAILFEGALRALDAWRTLRGEGGKIRPPSLRPATLSGPSSSRP
ncbi:MAG: nucleotidyltransferase domain-containing protein [Elusimicrobiota bacterium]